MKILILNTNNQGLLSGFFQELSEKLSTDGHDVVNFCLKHKKSHLVRNGVEIYGERRGGYFTNYYQIYKIIKKTKPHVVVSNFSYINPAILFGRLLGVKQNIAWFHTAYEHTKPSRLKVLNKRFYLKMADTVIANSKLLEAELHDIYGVSPRKTHPIPFWTNISNYSDSMPRVRNLEDGILRIGCPGRLLEDKNHQIVINAVSHLKKQHGASIELYIAGGGAFRNDLDTLVTSLHLESTVTFLGVLSVHEMVEFYKDMDVIVLPSLNEAFGLVFIEAIALGRPVIVSSQFGALDFIDSSIVPISSFTFDPTSVTGLQEHLLHYLNNKGIEGSFFEDLYNSTFDKVLIYEQIKAILTSEHLS